jgi:hypothetical protein
MSFSIRREQGLLCHRVSKYVTIEFLTFMSNDLLITYMFNNVIHIHFCVSGDIFIFLVRVPPPFSIFVLSLLQYFPFPHGKSSKLTISLRVRCSPWDPRFVGSNLTEVDGFFQDVKILSTNPPGRTLSWASWVWDFRLVKEPQAWKK